jgi:hypothetical protein
MGCIVLFISLITPRLAVVLLWLFSGWFKGIFPTMLVPILGFIFLPTTLLWYTAVQHWYAGQWSVIPVIGLIIAVLIDLSPARGGRRWRRARQQ